MKKLLCILICLLFCLPAFAQSETVPAFSGTKEWPEFRDMQFGLSLQAVAMREESRGLNVSVYLYEDTPVARLPERRGEVYSLIARDVPLYGETGAVLYKTVDGTWISAVFCVPFASLADAQAFQNTVAEDLASIYGEADETAQSSVSSDSTQSDASYTDLEWYMGSGFQRYLPAGDQPAEGFSGTLTLTLEQATAEHVSLGANEGDYIVCCSLSSSYQVNPEKAADAFFSPSAE